VGLSFIELTKRLAESGFLAPLRSRPKLVEAHGLNAISSSVTGDLTWRGRCQLAKAAFSIGSAVPMSLVPGLFMLTSVIPVPTAVPGTAYVHLQMSSRAYHAGTTALAPVLFAATRSAISVLRDRKFVAPVPRARSRRLAKARNLTDQPKAYPLAGSARTRRRFCRLHPARVRLIDVWRLRLCSLLVPPRPTALPLTDRGGGQ